ncbi:PREDICTED: uncharacterized protein LOC106806819 [Priapulus caudatus]|uniref:Uncharacterized protein LOC106806819 n=1 Tax=Priapulus caudatus TaxID=37621 RepID=A0ABM1DWV1_PRICU|nr:PREDICTED: uncharacterized protein LOC106806819 [Priapulus caudatus]
MSSAVTWSIVCCLLVTHVVLTAGHCNGHDDDDHDDDHHDHHDHPTCVCNVTVVETPCDHSWANHLFRPPIDFGPEWELVFKATAGVPMNLHTLWMSDSVLHVDVSEAMIPTSHYRINYKSHMANDWTNIEEVKLVFLKNDEVVVFVNFNGWCYDRVDWFSEGNMIDSSFSDLPGSTSITSIAGDSASNMQRRFFIHENYYGCNNDPGWIVVLDKMSPQDDDPCDWGIMRPSERPMFLYCPDGQSCLATTYTSADTMLILVRHGLGSGPCPV